MWNIFTTIVIVLTALAIKPVSINQEVQNNPTELNSKVITATNKVDFPKTGSITTQIQGGVKKRSVEVLTPTQIQAQSPSVTPTPTTVPTIHIQEPPDGFTVSITPTPTSPYYDEELPYDPLPTRNPCYCDPSKEKLCPDIYSC